MDADEKDIFQYLKNYGGQFVNAKEICRRAATKRRFAEEPDWAKVVLVRMTERRILEADTSGRYRIKAVHKKGPHKWMSPEIAKILEAGGVEGKEGVEVEGEIAPDEHYEQL
jgi:hypothetical protein